MKNIYFLLAIVFLGFSASAQNKKRITFDASGELKIVQFTDTHIELDKKKNLDVYEKLIPQILEYEKPDLVVITGDIVTDDNPEKGLSKLTDAIIREGIPYAIVFGNHDSERNLSRKEVAAYIEKLPGILNKNDKKSEGYTNFVLPVYGKGGETSALLYFMDSNDYSTLQPRIGGWGWFTHAQVDWYRKQSKKHTLENNGVPYPALAFFHIPFPEYEDAWNNKTNPPIGGKEEDICSPLINTGMFAAMVESGDVMGTFVGHDHHNDYIGVHYGIALAYGRVAKTNAKFNPGPGARVIVLKEGKRTFDTWIREINGNKVYDCKYPDSFSVVKKK